MTVSHFKLSANFASLCAQFTTIQGKKSLAPCDILGETGASACIEEGS